GRLAADARAAMPAHVEEGAQRARLIAQRDDRFARDRARDEVARLLEHRSAADAIPAPPVDLLRLFRQQFGRHVAFARQRARAGHEAGGGLAEIGHETRSFNMRWAASQPAPPSTPGPGWQPAPPR